MKKKQLIILLEPALKSDFQKACDEQGVEMSSLLREMINHFVIMHANHAFAEHGIQPVVGGAS